MSSTGQALQSDGSLGAGDGSAADSQNAAAGSLDSAGGKVDKIRDILFGANMREYEARFARLEETLMKEAAELRESSRRRFETLENYIRKEIESLQSRLKTERDERSDAFNQYSREFREMGDALTKRIRDLDDHGASVASSLRQEILTHSQNLMEELRARQEDVSSLLEKRFQVLQHAKTDRATLASLLNELALRISDEFHIPTAEK
jgi:hypothetical protein